MTTDLPLYHKLFETADEAIFILRDRIFTDCNKKALELFDYEEKEQLIGQPPYLLFPPYQPDGKDSRKESNRLIAKALNDDQTLVFEWQHQKKNGSPLFTEVNLSPIKYNNSIYLKATIRDITARKLSERHLMEKNIFIENIVDASPEIIYIFDLFEKTSVYINDNITTLLGYTPQEIGAMGIGFFQLLIHPEDLPYVGKQLQRWDSAREDEILEAEYRIKAKDDRWLWLHSRSKIFKRNEEGQVQQIIGFAQDITKRKIAEEELKKSLQEKVILLKEVHHRVKNNMQLISSLLSLQTAKLSPGSDKTIFDEAIKRISSLALVHEKIYMSENFAEIDFKDYIKSLTLELSQIFSFHNQQIKTKINIEKLNMDIDQAIPCALIINELYSNAIIHGFQGVTKGNIQIDFVKGENEYYLSLTDDGIPFPPDFELSQINSLGLSLVLSLVRQLGGKLDFQKENKKFTIMLHS